MKWSAVVLMSDLSHLQLRKANQLSCLDAIWCCVTCQDLARLGKGVKIGNGLVIDKREFTKVK